MVQSKAFFEKMLADLQTQLKNANINLEETNIPFFKCITKRISGYEK